MSNPIPPVAVDIVAGQNTAIPEIKRTGEEIHRVAAGANAGLSPVQKLSKAMLLSEGREGSLVLREMRGAVTTLGADAIGAAGPVGRLAVTLAEFGIGGAVGLVAVAAIAAVGYGVRELTASTKEATKAQEDFLKSLAKTPKGALDAASNNLATQREKLAEMEQRQALAEQLGGRLTGGLFSVGGFNPDEMEAQRRAVANAVIDVAEKNKALRKAQDDLVAGATREADALQLTVMAREQAIASGERESTTLVHIAEITARAEAAARHLDEAHTTALVTQAMRLARLKEENHVLEEQRNLLEEGAQISADISRFMAGPQGAGVIQNIHRPDLDEILGRTKHGFNMNEDIFGAEQGRTKRAAFDLTQPQHVGAEIGKGFIEAALNKKGPDAGAIANNSIALISAIQGGSAGAAVSEVGGMLSLALKSSPGVGQAVSIAGSVLSLLDNSAERRHREMLRELRLLREKAQLGPTQVRPVFVLNRPGDAAQTAYDVGRLQDRDAIPRGVGGP